MKFKFYFKKLRIFLTFFIFILTLGTIYVSKNKIINIKSQKILNSLRKEFSDKISLNNKFFKLEKDLIDKAITQKFFDISTNIFVYLKNNQQDLWNLTKKDKEIMKEKFIFIVLRFEIKLLMNVNFDYYLKSNYFYDFNFKIITLKKNDKNKKMLSNYFDNIFYFYVSYNKNFFDFKDKNLDYEVKNLKQIIAC